MALRQLPVDPRSTRGDAYLLLCVRSCLVAVLLAGCLPQVGPPVDGGVGGGGATGGSGGGGGGGGGGGSANGGGGGSNIDGGPGCSDMMHDGDETDVDCGGSCAPCALTLACAGPGDCDSGVCSASHCAAPADACISFGACTTFTDFTAPAADRTISFGMGQNVYTPNCMRVKLGQSVTFDGNFSNHPMTQACGPALGTLAQSNGNSASFTFDSALGVFGFYCQMHGAASGAGMAGAIEVVR